MQLLFYVVEGTEYKEVAAYADALPRTGDYVMLPGDERQACRVESVVINYRATQPRGGASAAVYVVPDVRKQKEAINGEPRVYSRNA